MRQRAAENLGALSRMSLRVDALAGDLAASAAAAEPNSREAVLTALRGLLLASGERLSPPVLSKLGTSLQALLLNAGAGRVACCSSQAHCTQLTSSRKPTTRCSLQRGLSWCTAPCLFVCQLCPRRAHHMCLRRVLG